MHLIALDTVQVSSVQPDPLLAGDPFEVNDADGKSLVERGLARAAKAGDPKPAEKAEDAKDEASVTASKPVPAAKPKVD